MRLALRYSAVLIVVFSVVALSACKSSAPTEEAVEPEEEPEAEEPELALDTAESRVKARAEAMPEPEDIHPEDAEPADTPASPQPPGPSIPPAGRGGLTKEKIGEYLGSIDVDTLPEEVIIDNNVINLRELKEIDPDQFNAVVVLANYIGDQKTDGLQATLKGSLAAAESELDKFRQELYEVRQELFDANLSKQHADWEEVVKTSDYADWFEKQPDKIKELAKTWDAAIAADLLSYYKESVAVGKVAAVDAKAKREKGKHDSIHKDTLRSDRKAGGDRIVSHEGKDEALVAFDEEDED